VTPSRLQITTCSAASRCRHKLARELLGGEVAGGQVRCPGPNHSPADRSLSVKLDPCLTVLRMNQSTKDLFAGE
jgi:hypothetical protein